MAFALPCGVGARRESLSASRVCRRHRSQVLRGAYTAPPPSPAPTPPADKGAAKEHLRPLRSPPPRFYDFSREDVEAIRIRHVRVDTEPLADSLLDQVRGGRTSLTDLATSVSTCTASRESGGDLGWWWLQEAVPDDVAEFGICKELLEAATAARPLSLSKVESPYGWHVFVVEDVRHHLRPAPAERVYSKVDMSKIAHLKTLDHVRPPVSKSYHVQTLGCQMNRADSERMAGELERLGYHHVDDPFAAEVMVLNTCSIRDHAEQKVYSLMGRHAQRKRAMPQDITLIVAGCVAQQEGLKLLRRVPELDLVLGPQYAGRLGDLLDDVKTNMTQVAATEPVHIMEDISKPRRESSVTAWLNVIYGCLERCTYCVVPFSRGLEQSRTLEAIQSEMQDIAKQGFREVVLLGQNIDAYGRDMSPKRTFAELLRAIHDTPGIERIRFTTSHPRYMSTNLIATCAELPKIMPSFHIPPQAGDNDVLKAMKRGYTAERYVAIVQRIREMIPDAAIAGDMIVGFPGETEEQFQHTMDLMRTVRFDVMNTAAYSPRPNTPAATWTNQVGDEEKIDRLARLNALHEEIALERSQRYVGRLEEVLVEEAHAKDSACVTGRTRTNKPVKFPGSIDELRGKLVNVRITSCTPFTLSGVVEGQPW